VNSELIPAGYKRFSDFDRLLGPLDEIYRAFKEQLNSRGQHLSEFESAAAATESVDHFGSAEVFGFYQWGKWLFDAYGEPTCLNSRLLFRKAQPKYLLVGTE
jgi:hypothetical protein